MSVIDADVFSCILSHIYDKTSLYGLLTALPIIHPLFPLALHRLCQLPIYLTCTSPGIKDTPLVLDWILGEDSGLVVSHFDMVATLRHLVIDFGSLPLAFQPRPSVLALEKRLDILFSKARNLRSLDWHNGSYPRKEHLTALGQLQFLETFRIDAYLNDSLWNLDTFTATIGPKLKHLELRRVTHELLQSLASRSHDFSTYFSLQHLFVDLTEGTWDWDGSGSPQQGPTSLYIFPPLRFPAIRKLELQVSDLTLRGSTVGPMNLVRCDLLETLTIIVIECFTWTTLHTIRLFMALPPIIFPALRKLEIRDEVWQGHLWATDDDSGPSTSMGGGRCYWGLVPSFLASVNVGHLSNLVHLWVDQEALCMPKRDSDSDDWTEKSSFYTVKELCDQTGDTEVVRKKAEWVGMLKLILGRLETLRVGFGALDDVDVSLILVCCNPAKLTHFGFWWNWQAYGDNEPISPTLLITLLSLPKLADVHIIHARPGTKHIYYSPNQATNPVTLRDIGLIFQTIPNICRVGLGHNAVWERTPALGRSDQANQNNATFICMHDALAVGEGRLSELSHDGIPEFYRGQPPELWDEYGEDIYDDETAHGQEVKELRDLLRRILPQHPINQATIHDLRNESE